MAVIRKLTGIGIPTCRSIGVYIDPHIVIHHAVAYCPLNSQDLMTGFQPIIKMNLRRKRHE